MYMDLLSEVESQTSEKLVDLLAAKSGSATVRFHIVITTVSVSVFLSSMLIAWYIYKAWKMMNNIQHFTERLAKKTEELEDEQEKTDAILYQILPVAIVKRLKSCQSIEPKEYESVTTYFSEIVGFPPLVENWTPRQVRYPTV